MTDSTVVRKDRIPFFVRPKPTAWPARYVWNWVSAVHADANKICDWKSEELAAEAKNAGRASERNWRISRPPCLIDKLACNHCVSDRLVLVMRLSDDLKCPSNKSRVGLSTDGSHRKRCWTLGALKETQQQGVLGTKQRKSVYCPFQILTACHLSVIQNFASEQRAPSWVALSTLIITTRWFGRRYLGLDEKWPRTYWGSNGGQFCFPPPSHAEYP